MGKFDKKDICGYCGKKMDAKYRSKRFCSDKCRVYFNRENAQLILRNAGEVTNIQNIVTEVPSKKEMTKAELLKLMKDNGEF